MIMKDVHQKCDKLYDFINSYEQSSQLIKNKIDCLNMIKLMCGYDVTLNLIEIINDQEGKSNIM